MPHSSLLFTSVVECSLWKILLTIAPSSSTLVCLSRPASGAPMATSLRSPVPSLMVPKETKELCSSTTQTVFIFAPSAFPATPASSTVFRGRVLVWESPLPLTQTFCSLIFSLTTCGATSVQHWCSHSASRNATTCALSSGTHQSMRSMWSIWTDSKELKPVVNIVSWFRKLRRSRTAGPSSFVTQSAAHWNLRQSVLSPSTSLCHRLTLLWPVKT